MSHTLTETCGCKVALFPEPTECSLCHQVNPVDHYTLQYCPLHAVALELKESLATLIEIVESIPPNEVADRQYYNQAIQDAQQTVQHAEGKVA